MCVNKRCGHGAKRTLSNSKPCQVDTKDIELEASGPQKKKRRKSQTSAIAECLPMDKKMISNDKLTTCLENTQVGQSSRTSVQGSISKEKDLKPFFDSVCKEMSQTLSWHTRTGSQGLDTNSSSISWSKMESNCCVTMKTFINPEKLNSLKISSASSQSSVQESTDNGTTTRIRRVIINPPKDVALKLKQWFGACRLTYNMALGYIKDGYEHKKTFYWLRNRFVNESNIPPSKKFLIETPKHVRECAVKDLSQAFKLNFQKKRRKDSTRKFEIKFRSKKDIQSITIPKAGFKQTDAGAVLYPTMLSKEFIFLPQAPHSDCKLTIDRLGRFILCVPVEIQNPPKRKINEENIVSLDPGVRTFLTGWSPNGTAFKLGDGDSERVLKAMVALDKLISLTAKATGRSKNRMKKVIGKMRTKLENLQRDLHYQCANFLVSNYDKIVIPVFGSKNMSSKLNRKLTTKTVRSMLGLGHFAFRQRLKEVAEQRGVVVFECTEEYTSKTCSCCGWIHPCLGGAKTFTCKNCGLKIDRDLQGAFNVFLKFVKEHPEVYSEGRGADASP